MVPLFCGGCQEAPIIEECNNSLGRRGLKKAHWECWSECNLDCPFCFRTRGHLLRPIVRSFSCVHCGQAGFVRSYSREATLRFGQIYSRLPTKPLRLALRYMYRRMPIMSALNLSLPFGCPSMSGYLLMDRTPKVMMDFARSEGTFGEYWTS
jgi:hypothetical protein